MSSRKNGEARFTADTLKLDDGLGFLVRLVHARANLLFAELTGQTQITPRQFGVLLTLHQRGSLTLTDLALAIRIDRSTLSEMVRRMNMIGFLDKSDNGSDGRSFMVRLTPNGLAAVNRLIPGAARLQGALLGRIPRDERRRLLHWMKLIAAGDGEI